MPVAMCPGAMQFTRMPWSARSIAADRLNATTAAFETRYTIGPAPPVSAAIDAVLMIEPPPCSAMWRAALGADHHAEEVDAHHPLEVGEVVVEDAVERARRCPALLNITSSPPNCSTAKSTSRLHVVGVGHVDALERGRVAEGRPRAPRRAPSSTSAMTTCAPSATNSSAVGAADAARRRR